MNNSAPLSVFRVSFQLSVGVDGWVHDYLLSMKSFKKGQVNLAHFYYLVPSTCIRNGLFELKSLEHGSLSLRSGFVFPAAMCVYNNAQFQQGQQWQEGCSKVCRCEDAENGLYVCTDR